MALLYAYVSLILHFNFNLKSQVSSYK